ncbi:leucine-rich repeat domain-containing protein [Angustibacter luteus]|uniref:Leucine-rich repeat domain-containing protein n=1 Tax=Angustibacter luteus TaxID=658456 RepID=A0ABW1JEI5_9ACTN
MITTVAPGRVQASPPLHARELEAVGPEVTSVQFHEALGPDDHAVLSAWATGRPQLGLRVFGNYRRDIQHLEFLRQYPALTGFGIDTMQGREPVDLSGLRFLPADLHTLRLGVRAPVGADLDLLARLSALRSLAVSGQRRLPSFLSGYRDLQELSVEGPVANLDSVATLPDLRRLTLRSVNAKALEPLTALDRLDTLVVNLGSADDLRALPSVGRLRHLALWQVRGLTDLSAIGELDELETLRLESLRQVTALPDLSRLTRLHTIHLETMRGLSDLGPLRTAPALRVLRLVGAGHLEPADLRPLVDHPTLQRAGLGLGSIRRNRAAHELVGLPDA